MGLRKRIKEIIGIIEESNVNEVEVSTWWGRKIRVVKNASGSVSAPGPASSASAASPTSAPSSAAAPESPAPGDNGQVMKSPIVGTFYRSPAPESPAFISVGDHISVGQTFCIVEAMKIMNEIESEVAGTVLEILPENGSPVEYDQPLVVVRPD